MTVTATIPQETFIGSGVNMSASFTFSIEVKDPYYAYPCDSMIITAESISDVTLDASEFVEQDFIDVTVPFTDFICEDKVSGGAADCG